MKIAGFHIEHDTTLQIVNNNRTEYVVGNDTFKITDSLRYEDKWIYIRKLYRN